LAAQASTTVFGTVAATSGVRLPGAVITFERLDCGQTFTVVSGTRGLFRAMNLPAGTGA
jgi:hypothetical protein